MRRLISLLCQCVFNFERVRRQLAQLSMTVSRSTANLPSLQMNNSLSVPPQYLIVLQHHCEDKTHSQEVLTLQHKIAPETTNNDFLSLFIYRLNKQAINLAQHRNGKQARNGQFGSLHSSEICLPTPLPIHLSLFGKYLYFLSCPEINDVILTNTLTPFKTTMCRFHMHQHVKFSGV